MVFKASISVPHPALEQERFGIIAAGAMQAVKILVCIKQVPGTSKVQVDEKTGVLLRSGVAAKLNPYDLYALETALRLKEAHGAEVDVLTMGPPQSEAIVREAFWMGVASGALLSDRRFAGADCLATAYTLAQAIRALGMPDLILCGKQTTDGDTAQVGPELAEFLDLPHLTNVSAIQAVQPDALIVRAELPHEVQVVRIALPCLLTVEKGIFQPRLPSYRRKLASKGRPIRRLTLDDLPDPDENHYGLNGSPTRVVRIFPPEAEQTSQTWQGSGEELAEHLLSMLLERKLI